MSDTFLYPKYKQAVLDELGSIEQSEDVRILFAIESGSRAWGFPSPDSDYDARFIYVRRRDWYLTISPGRDVIEKPIDDLLDVSGWDLKKALGLLLKPNPVALEWLNSPIRYIWNDELCDPLKAFASEISHTAAAIYHYRSLAARQRELHIQGKAQINLKKLFYVLRPAMAIRSLRLRPDQFPPINFSEMMEQAEVPEQILTQILDLLALKSQTKEMGQSKRWPDLEQFIDQELSWAFEHAKDFRGAKKDKLDNANQLFRHLLNQAWCKAD